MDRSSYFLVSLPKTFVLDPMLYTVQFFSPTMSSTCDVFILFISAPPFSPLVDVHPPSTLCPFAKEGGGRVLLHQLEMRLPAYPAPLPGGLHKGAILRVATSPQSDCHFTAGHDHCVKVPCRAVHR